MQSCSDTGCSIQKCAETAAIDRQEIEPVDPRIVGFIKRHHVLTLATTVDDEPHCSSLFYTYLPQQNLFAVTSSDKTWHVEQLRHNARVAAAVVLETKLVGKIQGLQIRGRMYRPVGEESAAAKKAYLLRFPYAAVMDPDMWVIAPDYLKLTDNRLGFGTKLLWEESPVKSDQTK